MLETIYQNCCSSWIITTTFLAVFLRWIFLTSRRSKTMPPGPPTKFLSGSLGIFKGTTGTEQLSSVVSAVKEYGDRGVCTLYIGSRPVVFITDYETIKKTTNDDNFAGRPTGFRDEFFHRKGLIITDGDLWKEQRRFALNTLRDLGMGKNWLQDLIIEETKALVEDIRSKESQPVNPVPFLSTSVSNVICAIAYGKRFSHDDERFRRLTVLIGELFNMDCLNSSLDFFPILRRIPFSPFRARFMQMKENFNEMMEFLELLVDEHERDFQPGDKTDYIHAYMDEAFKQKADPDTTFADEQLRISLQNLFFAGTDTTSTTLAWSILYLVNNSQVYERVDKEVDSVIGEFVNMEDKDSLPYLQATIMEVQRMANLIPIPIRLNLETTTLNGYFIPANTMIMPLLYAVHMDERYFPEPHKFNPDRFLDSAGKVKKIDAFMPFSIGKRHCVGESLAKMELYIFFANLIKHFKILAPPGQILSTSDSTWGITHVPKPFQVIFQTR